MPRTPKSALQIFEEFWEKTPKQVVWTGENTRGRFFAGISFKSGRWRIISMLMVGPRGGLSERLIICDDAEPYDDHKVRLDFHSDDLDGALFSVFSLRRRAPDREARLLLVRAEMDNMHLQIVQQQRDWENEISRILEMHGGGTSVPTVRGGLPGLGHK